MATYGTIVMDSDSTIIMESEVNIWMKSNGADLKTQSLQLCNSADSFWKVGGVFINQKKQLKFHIAKSY